MTLPEIQLPFYLTLKILTKIKEKGRSSSPSSLDLDLIIEGYCNCGNDRNKRGTQTMYTKELHRGV